MTQVAHYGLHYAGGVGFLVQSSIQSIYDIPSPFRAPRLAMVCPHRINLTDRSEQHLHLTEDPLVKWLSRPTGVVQLLGMHHLQLVEQLTELFSPTRPLLVPAWGFGRIWRQELNATNLCPWFFVGATSRHMDILYAAEGMPRPVLVLTDTQLPGFPVLSTSLTALPDPQSLRRLGAQFIYERLIRQ